MVEKDIGIGLNCGDGPGTGWYAAKASRATIISKSFLRFCDSAGLASEQQCKKKQQNSAKKIDHLTLTLAHLRFPKFMRM